ncbi:MAG: GNAT family N-acetyltransferase [Erysipelotrichaceae bacterium]|nr:GNAT family N-acetyltransferase [Erysipelotrichaceae bacterium]
MIRKLTETDIPIILDIYSYYIKNTVITFETKVPTLDDFRKRITAIAKNYPFLIKEINGTIVGYAYLDHFNQRQAYDCTADLSIYLDYKHLGLGYGQELMEAIINEAKKLQYWNIVSIITANNTRSERIHARFGFEKMVTFKDFGIKFDQPLSISYYVLRLKEN